MSNAPVGKDGWRDFLAGFENREDKKQTLADYCEQHGVGYKTARNWGTKLRAEGIYPSADSNAKSGAASRKRTKSKDKPKGTGQKGQNKGQDRGKSAKDRDGAGSEGIFPDNSSTSMQEPPSPSERREILARLRNSFEPGNQAARTHGLYSRFFPPEVQAEMETWGRNDMLQVIEEIRLTRGRLIMCQQAKAAWDAKHEYNTLDDSDYTTTEIENGPDGKKTKKKRPDYEGHEDRLSRRLAWLMQVQQQLSRKASFSADEAIAARRAIIEQGEEAGWTFARIGMEIEKLGIELPFTLQALIKQELSQPQEEEDNSGFTDAELEEMSRRYEEEAALEGEWLESRQSEVKEIHDARDAEREAK